MKLDDTLIQAKIGFKPHAGQQQVLDCKERDITIAAGVRWGKSKLAGYLAFRQLLADNQRIWIVSLSYDMSKKIFDYVIEFAAMWDKRLLKGLQNRPFPRLEVKEWNSWIECKSAENESSLMGEELDLVLEDEAARMKPDIHNRYLMARLASRQGKSVAISTPFGQNWFHQRYVIGKENNSSFHFTSRENPAFPQSEWDRAKKILPKDIFDQEYEASFLSDAAAVFRNIKNSIGDCLAEPKYGHHYTMGLDLAKFGDFSVITVVDRQMHQVVFWDRFTKIPYTLQKERIINVARKYKTRIVIDALNVGAQMSDELRAAGLSVQEFKAVGTISKDRSKKGSKENLVEKLSSFLEEGNITIPPEEILIDELETYSYKMSPSGNFLYGAPEGFHDDAVVSLALAIWPLAGKIRREAHLVNSAMPVSVNTFQYK